jgi:diamine N-acetyltransferase
MISLEPITAANYEAALAIRVQPERLRFVASIEPVALIVLAKCWVNYDGQTWHPFVLTVDGQAVGLVAVGIGGDVAWVHHVLIDEGSQGRGYGRALMVAVGDWLRTLGTVTRVGLDVLPENEVAWGLYASLGFAQVGITSDGQGITMSWLDDVA